MKWQNDKWRSNVLKRIKHKGGLSKLSDERIKRLREKLEDNEGSINATNRDTGIGKVSIRKYGKDIIEKYRRKYQI